MKYFFLLFIFIVSVISNAQPIYLGLEYGMTKDQAILEFQQNKDKYNNIDLGNGFAWRLFKQNFIYQNDSLVGLTFSPVGGAFGLSYDITVRYLNYTRDFFEKKGYTLIAENEYWNAPENFIAKGYAFGLLLANEDQTIIVHLYPYKFQDRYNAYFKVLNYDWFIKVGELHKANVEEKQDNTGF